VYHTSFEAYANDLQVEKLLTVSWNIWRSSSVFWFSPSREDICCVDAIVDSF